MKVVEYIAKEKQIFIGLEDSKRTWKLCVRSGGMIIHEVSMEARYKILSRFLSQRFPDCDVSLIYESGFKGFTLYDKLVADGYHCVVTPAHTVTQSKVTKVKTDKVDARRLAIVLEAGDYKSCHVPDRELREDRQISRTLIQTQKDITRVKNRIRKFLDFHGYDEAFKAGGWYDRDYAALEGLTLASSPQFSFDLMLDQLKYLQRTKVSLTQKLKELSGKERYNQTFRLFTSAPGIGWFTSIRLVLEWGEDLSRFSSGKKFASFTGLTSSEFSTGDTIRRGRITKQSNPEVRAWLIECAWTAYKRDPVLLHKYEAVYGSTGSKKKAIIAVARVLAVRLRALVATQKQYQYGVVA